MLSAEDYRQLVQLGRRSLAGGQPDKAIKFFSLSLRVAPGDTEAQLSLAEAFARNGQVRRAEAYLRHLLKDPDQRANAKLYLGALALLYERYPTTVSGSFSILPSTNVENTSSNSYFDTLIGRFQIEGGGEETSGIGLDLGVHGKYRKPLDGGVHLEFGAALNHVWYDTSKLRYWRGRVTADVVKLGFSDDLRIGLHVDRVYYPHVPGKSSDRLTLGLHGYWSHSLGERARLSVSATAENRDYLEQDSLSGPFATVGVRWSKRLGSGATVFLGGSLERSEPNLSYHRYWGTTVKAGYERNLSDNFRAGISLGTTLRVYDTNFPAQAYERRDELFSLGLSASDSRIRVLGTTPRLSCEYGVRKSNIALYEMNSTDCRIGWEFRF